MKILVRKRKHMILYIYLHAESCIRAHTGQAGTCHIDVRTEGDVPRKRGQTTENRSGPKRFRNESNSLSPAPQSSVEKKMIAKPMDNS